MNNPDPYYRPPGMGMGPRRRQVHWLPIIIAVVFIVLALIVLLVALYPSSFGLNTSAPTGRFGPFGGFFLFFFVLIIGFFIVRVAFWSTRQSYGRRYGGGGGGGQGPGYQQNRPLMVARMRYARGEITREQYEQIVQDLRRPPGGV
jgi:uncharacterized membrane protein